MGRWLRRRSTVWRTNIIGWLPPSSDQLTPTITHLILILITMREKIIMNKMKIWMKILGKQSKYRNWNRLFYASPVLRYFFLFFYLLPFFFILSFICISIISLHVKLFSYVFFHIYLNIKSLCLWTYLLRMCACVCSVSVSKRGNTNRHVWMKSCWKYAERIENNRGNSLSNNSKVRRWQ